MTRSCCLRTLGATVACILLTAACSAGQGRPAPLTSPPTAPPLVTTVPATPPNPTPIATPLNPTPSATPVPSSPADAPDALAVTCADGTTRASSPGVRARRDGAHISAAGADGAPADVDASTVDTGVVATATGDSALVIPPGTYQLACVGATDGGPGATITVTDPDGLWVSSELTCEGVSGTTGSGGEPPAPPAAAIAYLRTAIQYPAGGVLEPAGYPEAPNGWIRLARDGKPVAGWRITGKPGGPYGIASTEHCPDAGIVYLNQ